MNTRAELIEVMASADQKRRASLPWSGLDGATKDRVMREMELRLQDIEAAGCVVVPRKLIAKCGNNHMNCPHSPAIKSWLAASPFAPEAKPPPP